MTKKLALVLAICVCAVPVFANNTNASDPVTPPEVKTSAEKATIKANPKVKKDIEKLLADVKAGKVAPRQQQFPPTAKSNMSKTTKIAIIATAIGVGIVAIWLAYELRGYN